MAMLSMAARKALPKSSFAVPGRAPGSGSYPMPDVTHARNALVRSSQFGSPAAKAAVKAKVAKNFPGIKVGGKKGKPRGGGRWASAARALQPGGMGMVGM